MSPGSGTFGLRLPSSLGKPNTLKSRFPLVEEAKELKKKLSEAVAPPKLTRRIQELEAQVAAKDETLASLNAELEAVHDAHLKDAALLEETQKEKEQ